MRGMATGDLTYNRALADHILSRLARGESLRGICRDPGISFSEAAVRSWAVDDVDGFAARYAQARDQGLDSLADEIIEISNTPVIGEKTVTKATGTETTTGDMVEHRRLQVDARKWYLAKLAPKRYGDKQEVTHVVEVETAELLLQGRKRSGG